MITTACEECCFLRKNGSSRGCVLNQACVFRDEQAFAPGYCRMCRSHKWVKIQKETEVVELLNQINKENELKFDLIVFFDEATSSIKALERTLKDDWYIKYTRKVIIADTTGFGKRENIALQYLNSQKHPVPTIVDSSVDEESISQHESTIKRVSRQVTSPFFMTIPAGLKVFNMNSLAQTVQCMPSRVIQWSFITMVNNTVIIPSELSYGLFITKPYQRLIKLPKAKSFSQQLRDEEEELNIKLSWFCQNCGLG